MKNYAAILLLAIFGLTILVSPETVSAAPSNDNLTDATPIVVSNGSGGVTTHNAGATKEAGEPNHAENSGGKSVWFSFTPTVTKAYRINTMDTNFDTLLAVYTGSAMGNLTLVGYNNDCNSGCGGASTVDVMMVGGITYYIAVDGYNSGGYTDQGGFRIALLEADSAFNNDLNYYYELGGGKTGNIAGTTFGATREPNEPVHYNATLTGEKSVWYKWSPNKNFAAEVELTESYDSVLAVYSANTPSPTFADLTEVMQSYDFHGYTSSRYRINFFAQSGKHYFIAVAGNHLNGANPEGNFQLKYGANHLRYSADYEWFNDKASVSLFRPSEGMWYGYLALNDNAAYKSWGKNGDTPVAADYDGNGRTDYAVTRNENGSKLWYINSAPSSYTIQWGLSSDKALTGDFDGDGRADLTVIRNSAAGFVWYVRQSTDGALRTFVFGTTGDTPVLGDFDGDGMTEVTVVRNTQFGMVWHMLKSGAGAETTYTQYEAVQFGTTPDMPAVQDFDGDGKTDIAVFRPSNGTWYIKRSASGELQVTQFGASGDKPQPADYDGDGKADLGLYRPTDGTWYFWMSGNNTQKQLQWGTTGDIATSSMSTLSQ